MHNELLDERRKQKIAQPKICIFFIELFTHTGFELSLCRNGTNNESYDNMKMETQLLIIC